MRVRLGGWRRAVAAALALASAAHSLRTTAAPRTAATALPAIAHQLAELVALGGGDCVAHVEAIVDRGLLEGELRGADFLQLAIDCGAVGLAGGEQIPQVDLLDLKVGAVANLGLAEIGFLLANLGELIVGDADLLANVGITQGARETELPLSHAETAPAHAAVSTEAAAHSAPSASIIAAGTHVSHASHLAAWPEAVARSLLLRRRILGVALR